MSVVRSRLPLSVQLTHSLSEYVYSDTLGDSHILDSRDSLTTFVVFLYILTVILYSEHLLSA